VISILFPTGINWFYERQARNIKEEFDRLSIPAELVDAGEPGDKAQQPDILLISNLAECFASANATGALDAVKRRLKAARRSVLLNHDCIVSEWFTNQIDASEGALSDIFDISMTRQTLRPRVFGVEYQWIPEALTFAESQASRPRTSGRPSPWAMVGHATRERTALAAALAQTLRSDGLVYCPPLRPFKSGAGLSEKDIGRILERADLYIWGSHHRFPYHECFRALHAVKAGAVPAKIDPLYASEVGTPWTYESAEALREHITRDGLEALYQRAVAFIGAHGYLGEALATALGIKATSETGRTMATAR
jgi:hypothetical protein